jgi:23S rRNA (uracil1939-C5)-methyltransferase
MNLISRRQCIHYGSCGGCAAQDVPYEMQLAGKQSALGALFRNDWQEPIPVTPSPVLRHYRNKIDPAFSFKWYEEAPPRDFLRETVLGFKVKGNWRRPLELEECLIAPEGVDALFPAVRDWVRVSGLKAYHSRKNEGYLRHLLIRDGKRTGERMVMLITSPGALPDPSGFVDAVQAVFPCASIYHGTFSGRADIAVAEESVLLFGKKYIEEVLSILPEDACTPEAPVYDAPGSFLQAEQEKKATLHFQISPMSFFQTNPLAAERLYGFIRGWCRKYPAGLLYDLYGGMGSIALQVSDLYPQIISVEEVAAASEDGRQNAGRNQVHHIEFVTASVQDFFKKHSSSGDLSPDARVILDPPRSGLHPKALRGLLEWAPSHLLYVSCNPARLQAEMEMLRSVYTLESLHAFDLFPHTPHVETVASFVRTQGAKD